MLLVLLNLKVVLEWPEQGAIIVGFDIFLLDLSRNFLPHDFGWMRRQHRVGNVMLSRMSFDFFLVANYSQERIVRTRMSHHFRNSPHLLLVSLLSLGPLLAGHGSASWLKNPVPLFWSSCLDSLL